MSQTIELHPDLEAALSVMPEREREVPLRGQQLTFFPIETRDYTLAALRDPTTTIMAFGVKLESGEPATAEEIARARENMSDATAALLISLSTRIPKMQQLAANLTPAEKARCLTAVFAVTTGGDIAGFFADVRAEMETVVKLISMQSKKLGQTSAPAGSSGTGTRSRSSSKRSATSKRK